MFEGTTGRDLRIARIRNRVTLMTLAKALGMTPSQVSAVEMGNTEPPTGAELDAWLVAIMANSEERDHAHRR